MPLLASFQAQQIMSSLGGTSSNQQASGSGDQRGPNGTGSGSSGGGASAFPFGQYSSYGSPSSSTAHLHPQPQRQQSFRSSTPPLSNLFHQGSICGSTGSGIRGGAAGTGSGMTGWSASGGPVEGATGGDAPWVSEDIMAKEAAPAGHCLVGGASAGLAATSGESLGMLEASAKCAATRSDGTWSGGGVTSGSVGDVARISLGGSSVGSLVSNIGGSLGRASVGTAGLASGGFPGGSPGGALGGACGGPLGMVSGESMVGSLGRPSSGSICSYIGGASVGGGSAEHISKAPVGANESLLGGSTTCFVTGTTSGNTHGLTVSSRGQSPVSTGSSNPGIGQLHHSQPLPKPPQAAPLQQLAVESRSSSGINLFNSPPNSSPSSNRGLHSEQLLDSSPSSLSHFNLAGLQSGFPVHQMSLEKSALASLAQYGSANASPCLTPVAPSPTIQSPVTGRTFYYSDPSSATGSHSSLLMPQSSLSSQHPNQAHTAGRDSPLGRFSEDLKFLFSSHPSIPQEGQVFDHPAPHSSIEMGYYPSPFSSPTLVPKSCVSVPGGRATPPAQTSPGHSHKTQSPGGSSALPVRRGSAAYASDVEPQTVRSRLPSNL